MHIPKWLQLYMIHFSELDEKYKIYSQTNYEAFKYLGIYKSIIDFLKMLFIYVFVLGHLQEDVRFPRARVKRQL